MVREILASGRRRQAPKAVCVSAFLSLAFFAAGLLASMCVRAWAQDPEVADISRVSNRLTVAWTASSGAVYRVDSNTEMSGGDFGWLAVFPYAGATGEVGYLSEPLTRLEGLRSYRVTDLGERDRDQDGVFDSVELTLGLDPDNPDSNGNGVPDGDEDSDDDGLSNRGEMFLGTSPTNTDSNASGTLDGDEDSDADGLPDGLEVDMTLNPVDADTDRDGKPDGDEDTDIDGVTNVDEYQMGLDPLDPDSDEDTWPDGAEIDGGSLPLDPDSTPFLMVVGRPSLLVQKLGFGGPGGVKLSVVVAGPPTRVLLTDPSSAGMATPNVTVAGPPVTFQIESN